MRARKEGGLEQTPRGGQPALGEKPGRAREEEEANVVPGPRDRHVRGRGEDKSRS